MKNICTMDFSNAENVGVLSSVTDGNELILTVIPASDEETTVRFSVEKPDGSLDSLSSDVLYGSATFVIPFSWYSTAGTLTLTDPYHNERQVIFNIAENLASNNNVQVRYSNRKFNVTALADDLPLASDYVIEDGQNTLWAWRKWKNGKFEAWRIGNRDITTNFPILNAGALPYASQSLYNTTGDASQFVTVEDVRVQSFGGGLVWTSGTNWSVSNGQVSVRFFLVCTLQIQYTMQMCVHIIGTWK